MNTPQSTHRYYFSVVAKKPKIFIGEGDLQSKVLPACSLLIEPYKPTPWASNTHAQTILGLMRKVTASGQYTRQLVMVNDGGTIGLDWYQGCDEWRYASPETPVHLVLHGINGACSMHGACVLA